MIIDSSAVLAALYAEPDRYRVIVALEAGSPISAGSPTVFESELAIGWRHGQEGLNRIRAFFGEFGIEEIAFDSSHRREASEAFLRFGKGRHPAQLNFGDCMTYAVAKLAGEPLLCIGEDFAQTDLELVLPAA